MENWTGDMDGNMCPTLISIPVLHLKQLGTMGHIFSNFSFPVLRYTTVNFDFQCQFTRGQEGIFNISFYILMRTGCITTFGIFHEISKLF